MSKSNSLRKAEQLELQALLIAEKKEQISQRNKTLKLLESYTQNCRSASTVPQLNAIPSSHELNNIPPSLSVTPKLEESKLEEIRVPPVASLAGSSIKVPNSRDHLIELVAANGDGYEDNLITQFNKNDLSQHIRFLFDKNSNEYFHYRGAVEAQRMMNEKIKSGSSQAGPLEPKIFGSTQESKAKTVTVIRNDDSESTNSDTETWKEAKERNLKNLKRKAVHSRSRKQQDLSTTDSSDDDTHHDENARFYDRKFKMSSASSTSSGNSKKSAEQEQQQGDVAQLDKTSESSARPPKRKKSRWGEAPDLSPTTTVQLTPSVTVTPTTVAKPMLTTITRSDPALLQYARLNFGTTNLSEDDWKKAEEHYKINLLFQDMQRKRQEMDHLAKNGKFKYEYDSDEDVNGGTWEHKLRSQEMEATIKWAEALNKQCEGKHHIGDFLPPEELKKFMEKYQSQGTTQPDVSDYKEFKLKEDNIGYKLLQKLGWKGEGTSLGASGSGITEPINKAPQREHHQGLGANEVEAPNEHDNEYDAYRKRMMLAYRFRPNPLNNPRRAYY